MSSRQNPWHLSIVATVMVIAFGGPYRFPGFCGNQHIRDPTWRQNRFLKRLGNMFLLFCIHLHAASFMFLSFACIFLSVCIHFLSFTFTVLSCSFHFNSNVHSCPFIFLLFPCIFLSFCIHFLSFLSKVMEMALWLGPGPSATNGCRYSKLSLRLSLNNPSNIWHCSKEICHKDRERESELDAKWYGNCRKQGTTGWISLIGSARSVNVHNSICLVYAKFNGLSCMVPGYRSRGGPIALQCFEHISD